MRQRMDIDINMHMYIRIVIVPRSFQNLDYGIYDTAAKSVCQALKIKKCIIS